ncbi:MAG: hypothetical protein Q9M33_06250 [Robiginitomaculum sp.]|nr:hypothetical protein [Robiginitomaculum sp.]MDQ7076475.1 hypothetical protein [Robiginitomaculum sp.]
MSLILAGAVLCLPALAQAGDYGTEPSQATSSATLSEQRKADTGGQEWNATKSIFIVDTHMDPVVKPPVSVLMHFVSAAMHKRAAKGQHLRIKHYIPGENKKSWYALAGAGGHAVALNPGAPIESDALRLQRRAKIGVAQVGVARDIGGGRVILGYLRSPSARDALLPFARSQKGQDLAALTLTIKH